MDRRVRKTREALYSAFVSLIAEKGYDRLSIQDILDAADVGRTTFYAHFRTKEDLLRFGFERLRIELSDVLDVGQKERWAFLEPLLHHARAHAGLFRALSEGGGAELAEGQFVQIIEDLVATAIGDGEKRSLQVAMMVGALLAGIRTWIASGGTRGGEGVIVGSMRAMATALATTQARA